MLATQGRLKDPAVLEQQVRRMLGDPRRRPSSTTSRPSGCSSGRSPASCPMSTCFRNSTRTFGKPSGARPSCSSRASSARIAAWRIFSPPNYTFLNERLARHYGIPNVYGSHFRRVTLSNPERGGLLGQGSLLTVTSYPNRTSPVLRGKWVLDNILGSPPPPPPPDVPDLARTPRTAGACSMRERMEVHRRNPCARAATYAWTCWDSRSRTSTRLDAGAMRPTVARRCVGSAARRDAFKGLSGLRRLMVSHRDEFVGTVTEKLLTYALGRGNRGRRHAGRSADLARGGSHDYRWSSLILGVRQEPAVPDVHARDSADRASGLSVALQIEWRFKFRNKVVQSMIVTKKSMPRRTVLRGIGAALALPLLDSMVPALTALGQTAATVRRFGVIYVPNGMIMEHWTPTTEGAAFELTPILQPLAPFRDRLLGVERPRQWRVARRPGGPSARPARGS